MSWTLRWPVMVRRVKMRAPQLAPRRCIRLTASAANPNATVTMPIRVGQALGPLQVMQTSAGLTFESPTPMRIVPPSRIIQTIATRTNTRGTKVTAPLPLGGASDSLRLLSTSNA